MALLTLNSMLLIKLLLWAKGREIFLLLKGETKSPKDGIENANI